MREGGGKDSEHVIASIETEQWDGEGGRDSVKQGGGASMRHKVLTSPTDTTTSTTVTHTTRQLTVQAHNVNTTSVTDNTTTVTDYYHSPLL